MPENENAVATTVVTVTSENLEEFTAKKLGLADAPAPVEAESVESTESEPTAENQSGQKTEADESTTKEDSKVEAKEKPKNPKIERRFSEITKEREDARAEAKKERETREALELKVRELESKENPVAEAKEFDDSNKPNPKDFSDMYEYAEALAEYSSEKKLAQRDREEQNRKVADANKAKFEDWGNRINAAKTEMPDFDDMLASSEVRVSDQIRDAIIKSPVGPRILYHLAENDEAAKKLSELPVEDALIAFGKIEATFESKPEKKSIVAKTKAPAPINPIKGAVGTVDNLVDSNGNFTGSYQQFVAAREKGLIR